MTHNRGTRRVPGVWHVVWVATCVVGAMSVPTNASGVPGPTPAVSCPWLDSSQPVTTRVDELLARMTPYQEASMLYLHNSDASIPYEGYTDPIPSLCIPRITQQDGAAGVAAGFLVTGGARAFSGVTQLPDPIVDAAAFDPALALQYGDVIGAEDAAKGIDLALAPTLNIDRDPLWGRSYETVGEDPYLAAVLGPQLVTGIQRNRVVSVVKHYVGYDQEQNRDTLADDAIVGNKALREVYLPPFATAVEDGNGSAVMCAYNSIDGTPACESSTLLSGILRQEWRFSGFVRSDCGSVYNQDLSIAAGVSQVKCTSYYEPARLASDVFERQDVPGSARHAGPTVADDAVRLRPHRSSAPAGQHRARHELGSPPGCPADRRRGGRPAQEHRTASAGLRPTPVTGVDRP